LKQILAAIYNHAQEHQEHDHPENIHLINVHTGEIGEPVPAGVSLGTDLTKLLLLLLQVPQTLT